MRRRTGAGGVVVGLLTAVLSILSVLGGPAAQADSPQRHAIALAAQLRDLQSQAEAQTELYDAAQGRLAEVVAQSVRAAQDRDAAVAAQVAGDRTAAARIRSLYEFGGPGALYAQVLTDGGDPATSNSGCSAYEAYCGPTRGPPQPSIGAATGRWRPRSVSTR